jgi:hypothetical protein
MGGGHDAALFHGVVEEGQGGGGAVGAADLQAHLLQDAGHRVAHSGGGGQGEVHDAEGHVQAAAGLLGHQLAHAGDAEGGLFDGLRHHVEGGALHVLEGVVHHTGAGDAHIDDAVALAHAVEGAGHEGVVLHRVAEYHQLGAAEAATVRGALRSRLDGPSHEGHRVHIDARLGGAHVHRGTHQLGGGQGLGDGVDELPVPGGEALLHQGGEAADEVDAGGVGGPVQGGGKGHVVPRYRCARHQRDGGDGNALVDDGNAELPLNGLAGGHQLFGPAADFVVDLPAGGPGVGVAAVQQGDAHGNGADVQVLLVDHVDGVHDFRAVEHKKNLLVLCQVGRYG